MMPGYDVPRIIGIILYKSRNFGTKFYVVNGYFSGLDIFMGPNFRYTFATRYLMGPNFDPVTPTQNMVEYSW